MFPKESHFLPAARRRAVLSILNPARNNQAQGVSVRRQDTRPRALPPRINSFRRRGRANSGTFNQLIDRAWSRPLEVFYLTSDAARGYDRNASRHRRVHVPPQGRCCTAASNPLLAWTADSRRSLKVLNARLLRFRPDRYSPCSSPKPPPQPLQSQHHSNDPISCPPGERPRRHRARPWHGDNVQDRWSAESGLHLGLLLRQEEWPESPRHFCVVRREP